MQLKGGRGRGGRYPEAGLERLAGVTFLWATSLDFRKFRDFLCVLNRSKSGPWVRREFSCFAMENSGVIFTAAIS